MLDDPIRDFLTDPMPGGIRPGPDTGHTPSEGSMMEEKQYKLQNLTMEIPEGKEPTLSQQDRRDQLSVLAFAMHIHERKERVRRGLWKEYPALDQVRQIKIKAERIIQILERMEHDTGEELDEETAESILEEFGDIINYSAFGHRIVNGRADPRNTLR